MVAAAGVTLDTVDYELGAGPLPEDRRGAPRRRPRELRAFDAILLGAVGPPVGSTDVPTGLLERGLLLRLRFELDLYINLRPFNGVPGPIAPDCDFVRRPGEHRGALRRRGRLSCASGTPYEVATQGSVNTRHRGRALRALRLRAGADAGPRQHLTLVHKTNVLTFAGDLWQRTFDEVAAEYPEVAPDYNHVDAACIYLVERPDRYDVIVTDNLFGDILTDLGRGGDRGHRLRRLGQPEPGAHRPLALRARARRRPRHRRHRTANPLAAIRSAALMLEHLGERRRPPSGSPRRCSTYMAENPARTAFRSTVAASATPSQKGCRVPITPTEKIWMDGEFVDWDKATVHVLTHSLHYGTGVFEGIRAYPTSKGSGGLPPARAHPRFVQSAKILMMDMPFTVERALST